MKKLSALLLVFCMLFAAQMTVVATEASYILFRAAPIIKNDRIMLPIQIMEESFNLYLKQKQATQIITENIGKMKVHFIDVGQGDSIFIELPGGKTILIDAGKSKSVTADYISALGYSAVSYIVATHPDADHITGMPEVLNRFSVGEFYMPDKVHTSDIFEKMLNSLQTNGCSVKYAQSGQSIIESSGALAEFIAPVRSYSDNNNSSAVVKLSHGENTFLFTGDIELDAENDIINSGADILADVLKVSHHGAKNASSAEFIEKAAPVYAVISVGENNSYGHPAAEVLSLLQSHNAQVLRTDENGTIIITSDGSNLTIDRNKTVVKQGAPPAEATDYAVVYKTKTGTKYHMAGCSFLKSSIQTTVEQAESEGLTPCSKCNPLQ